MSYNLVVSPRARQEQSDAYPFYEDILEGLGERFLVALKKSYDNIVKNPLYYSLVGTSKVLRDKKVTDFPYIVIYTVVENAILIMSVRHTSRQPYI